MDKKLNTQLILVIDDTEVVRSLLSEALTDKGYTVKSAPDAHTGIELATQLRPGMVFCDTYMPDLDGFEAVRRIRKALPDAVVVMTNSMMSGDSEPESERAFDYLLNKPFGLDELWNVLKKIEATFIERKSQE
jgi:CheY-like chemotaxis protein